MPNPFNSDVMKHLSSQVSRRSTLKKLFFGGSAAALTPMLGGVAGVHAASPLGNATDSRAVELTGKALSKEIKALQAWSEYQQATRFLAGKGYAVDGAVTEGVQLFSRQGNQWVTTVVLTVSYPALASGERVYLNASHGAHIANSASLLSPDRAIILSMSKNGTLSVYSSTSSGVTLEKTIAHPASTTASSPGVAAADSSGCDSCVQACQILVTGGCSVGGVLIDCGVFGESPVSYAACLAIYATACAAINISGCPTICEGAGYC